MAAQAPFANPGSDTAAALAALVSTEGTGAHRHPLSEAMARGPEAGRNVADVVHHLCLLHARHPGVIDHALARTEAGPLHDLLDEAAEGFAAERALLTKLVVAVGPLPSTPGHADAEAAVLAQHHAIDMLAQSDRKGCAAGAALALILDWAAIHVVIASAAHRLSIEPARLALPGEAEIAAAFAAAPPGAAVDRAMLFGAQQIVAQHKGLWDLLDARAAARFDY